MGMQAREYSRYGPGRWRSRIWGGRATDYRDNRILGNGAGRPESVKDETVTTGKWRIFSFLFFFLDAAGRDEWRGLRGSAKRADQAACRGPCRIAVVRFPTAMEAGGLATPPAGGVAECGY